MSIFKKITGFFTGNIAKIPGVGEGIANAANTIGDKMEGAATSLKGGISNVSDKFKDVVPESFHNKIESIEGQLTAGVDKIADHAEDLVDGAADQANKVVKTVQDKTQEAVSGAQDALNKAVPTTDTAAEVTTTTAELTATVTEEAPKMAA